MNKSMRFFVMAMVFSMGVALAMAQQEESAIEKEARLTKAADEAPQDWQKQFDAAKFFIETGDSTKVTQAEKYATRALEIAQAQTEKRDTILGKSLEMMSYIGGAQKNFDKMIGYYDMAIRAYMDELGYQNAAIPPRIAFLGSHKLLLGMVGIYGYGDVDAVKSLREAFLLNAQLPEDQRAESIEEAKTVYAMAHELLMFEQKRMMKDKVWQWTNTADGKTYILVGFDDWTLEQPEGFFATMFYNTENDGGDSKDERQMLIMDEQGNISEFHGKFEYNLRFNIKGNTYRLDDSTNLRLITIPAERRQQIIEAVRAFKQKSSELSINN